MLSDPNFKPPDFRPKITVVFIPRDEKSRINALRRAREGLRRKQRERQRRNLSTGRERKGTSITLCGGQREGL